MAPHKGRVRPRPSSVQDNRKQNDKSSKSLSSTMNGRTIGKGKGEYILGKTVGEGTFGKVKLGTQVITGEKVAIKVLEKSKIVDLADVRRVTREIKILKKNRHPNVIQLYEVVDSPSHIYLVMEYCDGGEMFDYIVSHRRVQEQKACWFFHQIVDGVEYFHNMEITHRDLKPENLLLQSSIHGWIVKVVDFGLSNLHEGGVLLSTACGSPCYAAPEMIAGKKYWGPKADTWSMGVILFALVCGFLPFEDSNTSVLYKKILSGKYSLPSWVSHHLRDLIKHILDTNPDTRYSVNEIRRHPWYTRVNIPPAFPLDQIDNFDENIIHELGNRGLDEEAVREDLQNRAHSYSTAAYYLILKRNRRKREKEEFLASQSLPERDAEAVASAPVNPSQTAPAIGPTTTEPLVLPDAVQGKAKHKDNRPRVRTIKNTGPQKQDMPRIGQLTQEEEERVQNKGVPRVSFKFKEMDESGTSAYAEIIDEGKPLSSLDTSNYSKQNPNWNLVAPHRPSSGSTAGKGIVSGRRFSPKISDLRRKSVEPGAIKKSNGVVVPRAPATTQNTPRVSPRASLSSPRAQNIKLFEPNSPSEGSPRNQQRTNRIRLLSDYGTKKHSDEFAPVSSAPTEDCNKDELARQIRKGRKLVEKAADGMELKSPGSSRPASPTRPPSSRTNRSPLRAMAHMQYGQKLEQDFFALK
mmetsp:Transcript_2332/g.3262  ORF Transcript_2332/g.3262 Transcript_2332/m.3262 type:complete len:691 (+) Transcript_2332:361-2433(+)|eukprot:CAMPEP_0117747218 /NCGR_PEP_ID=MMETSP0947-20121206/8384_1 /TAXON_ID=44440 /ORGANISM="Chattonella subsalsa, Strain CCMP2191" /LENGTH=690 /DNA_ID=CAMNT_0005564637 /DNA_START=139 /DNA_END=2211 /DNA_ORIENTATION=+